MLKELVKKLLRRLGLRVYRTKAAPRVFDAAHLRDIARARTVVDVGVGFGTTELYEAFPDARFILVEPLVEYRSHLDQAARQVEAEIYTVALGSHEGVAVINVDQGNPELSSLYRRTRETVGGNRVSAREVQMTTLDRIGRDHPDLPTPILLKLDTEGHELDVLRGGREFLQRVETILAEVSLGERFEGGYRFDELVAFLRDAGFEVFDILRVAHVEGELRTRFVDMVFKRPRPRPRS